MQIAQIAQEKAALRSPALCHSLCHSPCVPAKIWTCPYLWGRVASVARQVGVKFQPLTRDNPHHPLAREPFSRG